MASDLATDLMNKALGHTGVKQAIRPWWNILKDYCVVGVVILSVIVLPTTIFNDTPLDCEWCEMEQKYKLNQCTTENSHKKPNYSDSFVKKYCTYEYVDECDLYFPYILLLIVLLLFIMEPIFLNCCGVRMKLDAFFKLLETKSFSDTTQDEESTKLPSFVPKLVVEVAQSFRQSSTFYKLYKAR